MKRISGIISRRNLTSENARRRRYTPGGIGGVRRDQTDRRRRITLNKNKIQKSWYRDESYSTNLKFRVLQIPQIIRKTCHKYHKQQILQLTSTYYK